MTMTPSAARSLGLICRPTDRDNLKDGMPAQSWMRFANLWQALFNTVPSGQSLTGPSLRIVIGTELTILW